jgi:DNA-binding HxlR family transcriptional regulator
VVYRRVSGAAMKDPAELFEAISHPERIKILKILEKQPTSFASLKRQLGVESSGNVDFHLKKLGELVAVGENGLYGLTKAGKEALLAIEAVETWTGMEKRKFKGFRKMPKAALFLGMLEICTTVLFVWFFLAIMRVPFSSNSPWGYFLVAFLPLGFCSSFGIFLGFGWSRTTVLAKSAFIITMSCLLLIFAWRPGVVAPSISLALGYAAFAAAETVAVVVALKQSLRDFLGIKPLALPPRHAILGSLLCMLNGLVLALGELWQRNGEVGVLDTSVLCGLLVIAGGVLILLGNDILGAVISIIFGFLPPLRPVSSSIVLPTAYNAFDLIVKMDASSTAVLIIASVVAFFPIVAGLIAIASSWKIR